MMPVLYKFVFATALSRSVLYLLATALVGYALWAGWRGPPNASQERAFKLLRAVLYGALTAFAARFGFAYLRDGLPLHTYGLLMVLGFSCAISLAARMALKEWPGEEGLRKRDQILDLSLWVFAGGIIGARLLFIAVNWKSYSRDLSQIFQPGGGFVFYGGLVGAAGMAYAFARKHRIDFLRLADLAIPTVSLGQAFGRLGCFSAGCCWGDVTPPHFAWAARFPGAGLAKNLFGQPVNTTSLAYDSQADDPRWVVEATGQIFHSAMPGAARISDWVTAHGHTLPVHPTQIYEALGQLILFVALIFLRGYRRFHGEIFGVWLCAYAVLRSTVELFRGDVERGTLHGLVSRVPLEAWYNLSTSQLISLCLFGLGGTVLFRASRRAALD